MPASLSIGDFSRATHLSIKTLRYYHEVGLLEPAVIDPDSGYRYYRPAQDGYERMAPIFRERMMPLLDTFARHDVVFAHECHPKQFAYNLDTKPIESALAAVPKPGSAG